MGKRISWSVFKSIKRKKKVKNKDKKKRVVHTTRIYKGYDVHIIDGKRILIKKNKL